jgi:hypothetical protein
MPTLFRSMRHDVHERAKQREHTSWHYNGHPALTVGYALKLYIITD